MISDSILLSVMSRKQNFADCEIRTLTAKYNENKDVLNSELKTSVTAANKKAMHVEQYCGSNQCLRHTDKANSRNKTHMVGPANESEKGFR